MNRHNHRAREFPRRVPEYFEGLSQLFDGPIRRQFEPRDEELRVREYELSDPLGEDNYNPLPKMVHRYKNRILILVTDECAIHCRYCFRRRFTGNGTGAITEGELNKIAEYVHHHPEVHEVLLSGGDPLTLSDNGLSRIFTTLRKIKADLVFRVCTRIPGVKPLRITSKLVNLLSAAQPVWVVAQFNHPDELTPESTAAVGALVDAGIPVVSQTVLLRGINDNPFLLSELFRGLVSNRVKPYYLFQADLVPGTAHFRVPLRRSLAIVKELKAMISNLAMPVFAVDIPGGGGKITLDESVFNGLKDGWFTLTGPDGLSGRYPDEEATDA